MSDFLDFNLSGIPRPQGSKTARIINGKPVIYEASPELAQWRKDVSIAAAYYAKKAHWGTSDGPLHVTIGFRMPPPQKRVRDFPTVKPDLDKLIRGILDACTDAKIWKDDAQVVQIIATKNYPLNGEGPGVTVHVRTLS